MRITLKWRDADLDCTDHLHVANSSPPICLATLTAQLKSINGALLNTSQPSAVTFTQQPELLRNMPVSSFRSRLNRYARIALEAQRWYPAAALDGAPPDAPFFRIETMTPTTLDVDFNHPLADAKVTFNISAITAAPKPAGHIETPLEEKLRAWLWAGPGIQRTHNRRPGSFDSHSTWTREDNSDDHSFYALPRFVQHIDEYARDTTARLYDRCSIHGAQALDLMSSWVTHLPQNRDDVELTGLGLNAQELAQNQRLSHWDQHDLNQTPELPYADASFDVVYCSVSVEYLIRAREVFASVARVLRPGGVFINMFSDRCFPTKAIQLWAQLHPFERMRFVADLYQRDCNYSDVHCWSLQGGPRPPDDDYAGQMPNADPVFAVWARRT